MEDMEIVNISLYVRINTNIDKNTYGSDSLDKSMRPFKNSIEILLNCEYFDRPVAFLEVTQR